MSKERFNTLNSLRGWTWSKGNDFAFEKGIKYLIEYLEIHLSMDELTTMNPFNIIHFDLTFETILYSGKWAYLRL